MKPTLPPTPVGSPYGFTDEDWETVSRHKARVDRLYVVLGHQFSSSSYNSEDPLELTISDPDHSESEFRFVSLGMSASGHLLVVAYTEREGRTRIINAREATSQERKQYESPAKR